MTPASSKVKIELGLGKHITALIDNFVYLKMQGYKYILSVIVRGRYGEEGEMI